MGIRRGAMLDERGLAVDYEREGRFAPKGWTKAMRLRVAWGDVGW